MVSSGRALSIACISLELHGLPVEDAGDSLSAGTAKPVRTYAERHSLRNPAQPVLFGVELRDGGGRATSSSAGGSVRRRLDRLLKVTVVYSESG